MTTQKTLQATIMAGVISLGLASSALAQKSLYVTTNALPSAPYDTWATGFNSLQAALDYAKQGDTIYLAGHEFAGGTTGLAHPADAVFVWRNGTNIVLRGGYEASSLLAPGEHPGPRDVDLWPTVLTRTGGVARIFSLITVTNCTIEMVTISGGYQTVSQFRGAGVYLSKSYDVTFSQSRIVDNIISDATRIGPPQGGGLYLESSTLTISECEINNNQAAAFSPGVKSAQGGAIYVDGTSRLTVNKSLISGNKAVAHFGTGAGGGVYVTTGANASIFETVLSNNQATRNGGALDGLGGAIANIGKLSLTGKLFT